MSPWTKSPSTENFWCGRKLPNGESKIIRNLALTTGDPHVFLQVIL